jgi:hypothetical protein
MKKGEKGREKRKTVNKGKRSKVLMTSTKRGQEATSHQKKNGKQKTGRQRRARARKEQENMHLH